jgi:hypothetical protein
MDDVPASRNLLSRMAEEIARSATDHIRTMYPKAVEATTPNMLRSLRGCIINDIVSTFSLHDPVAMEAWLARREEHRKELARLKRLGDRAAALRAQAEVAP